MRAVLLLLGVHVLVLVNQSALAQRDTPVCRIGGGKKVTLAKGVPSCDLKLEGVDRLSGPLLAGGLDGIYKLESCMNGKPLYRRQRGRKGQERVLFFSKLFYDWDISNGTRPNEQDILMYGEPRGVDLKTPLEAETWLLGVDLIKRPDVYKAYRWSGGDYQPISARFSCAQSAKPKPEPAKPKAVPAKPKAAEKRPQVLTPAVTLTAPSSPKPTRKVATPAVTPTAPSSPKPTLQVVTPAVTPTASRPKPKTTRSPPQPAAAPLLLSVTRPKPGVTQQGTAAAKPPPPPLLKPKPKAGVAAPKPNVKPESTAYTIPLRATAASVLLPGGVSTAMAARLPVVTAAVMQPR
jgi:hypothetical protein